MLLVDEIERYALSERQVVATLLAAGAKKLTMPDPAELRKQFDAALDALPTVVDPDRAALLEVLGVRVA